MKKGATTAELEVQLAAMRKQLEQANADKARLADSLNAARETIDVLKIENKEKNKQDSNESQVNVPSLLATIVALRNEAKAATSEKERLADKLDSLREQFEASKLEYQHQKDRTSAGSASGNSEANSAREQELIQSQQKQLLAIKGLLETANSDRAQIRSRLQDAELANESLKETIKLLRAKPAADDLLEDLQGIRRANLNLEEMLKAEHAKTICEHASESLMFGFGVFKHMLGFGQTNVAANVSNNNASASSQARKSHDDDSVHSNDGRCIKLTLIDNPDGSEEEEGLKAKKNN